MKKTAQVIADILAEQGTQYVFGVSGGEVSEMIEALRRAGIQFVLVKHETVAAFIADAYGQITGKPGVCLSTLGPGATNMVSGIANAYLDRSPMIAISATVPRELQATFTHQVLDLAALFKPITKWNAQITPENAVDVLARAFQVAIAERPGPIHLTLPSDVAALPAQANSKRHWRSTVALSQEAFPASRLGPAAERIAQAQSPVLLVGLTAHRSGASREITQLAELLGAPVILTPKAKGTVSEDHPLVTGVVDMAAWKISLEMLQKADLFIAIGFDPVELNTLWNFDVPLIHIDPLPNHDQVYRADLEIVGDIRAILASLNTLVPKEPRWKAETIAEWKTCIAAMIAPPSDQLTPWYVIQTLRELLPRDAILSVDVGAHKQLAGQLWKAYQPNTYFNSNGLSSMGYAFPAAIGLKLARPAQTVVCLTGDGGFSMVLPDLETAVRLGLAFTTVVISDDCLSLIRIGQQARGYPAAGVESLPINFAQVAEGFGAKGITVRSHEQYVPALKEALASDVPVVVDVRVASSLYDNAL